MAFSPPGRASGVQTAMNTGGQVTMAANTPMPSSSMAVDEAPAGGTATVPSSTSQSAGLFDANHMPTLFHRIQTISKLLIEASTSANSLVVPSSQEADPTIAGEDDYSMRDAAAAATTTITGARNIVGPDITMGAMNEDDVTSGYEAALALSIEYGGRQTQEKVKRTELAQNIVLESQGLRDAFLQAQTAIDRMEGGEMDIEEQEKLIEILQKYRAEQGQVSANFGSTHPAADVSMSGA